MPRVEGVSRLGFENFWKLPIPLKPTKSRKPSAKVFTEPNILRENVPPQVLEQLLQRMREREIRPDPLAFLADWLDKEPKFLKANGLLDFPV